MGEKPVVWLHGEIKTPPFSFQARMKAGLLLRRLQKGEILGMPHSRPMATVGPRCHELRVVDDSVTWRILYRLDYDAVLVLEVFNKTTPATPRDIIKNCKRRLVAYDLAARGERDKRGSN